MTMSKIMSSHILCGNVLYLIFQFHVSKITETHIILYSKKRWLSIENLVKFFVFEKRSRVRFLFFFLFPFQRMNWRRNEVHFFFPVPSHLGNKRRKGEGNSWFISSTFLKTEEKKKKERESYFSLFLISYTFPVEERE